MIPLQYCRSPHLIQHPLSYLPHSKNYHFQILNKAKTEKELSITTEQLGCPTDTVNLSKFIIELMLDKNKDYGVYHFCDEKAMTWYDFAEQILIENKPQNIVFIIVRFDLGTHLVSRFPNFGGELLFVQSNPLVCCQCWLVHPSSIQGMVVIS